MVRYLEVLAMGDLETALARISALEKKQAESERKRAVLEECLNSQYERIKGLTSRLDKIEHGVAA